MLPLFERENKPTEQTHEEQAHTQQFQPFNTISDTIHIYSDSTQGAMRAG